MIGWVFDSKGEFVSGMTNDRVASAPLPTGEKTLIVAAARGANKVEAMRAALGRGLINGLITDEDTARNLLA
jgi:DNA-binding transcriptional regulator LsrR (DeoR family)